MKWGWGGFVTRSKHFVSPDAARPRRGRSILLAPALAAALSVGLLAFVVPSAAHAEDAETPVSTPETSTEPVPSNTPPTPTPTPSAAPAPTPRITSPDDGQFIGSGTTTVSGTREVNQGVQLDSPSGGDPLCVDKTLNTTTWSCADVNLPSGASITLRAVVIGDPTLSAEITVAVLAAPTVTGGPRGQGTSDGRVRGTGYPGASVTATLPGGGQKCTTTADGSGAWSCTLTGQLENGGFQVIASQKTDFSDPSSSNASEPVDIIFDLEQPLAPSLISPTDGAQVPVTGATYSGNGESGATVTVFVGPYSVCSAPVNDGVWMCSAGGVAAGSYPVIAAQQDAAGNVSPGSPAITVAYLASGTPQPTPGTGGEPTPATVPPTGSGASPSPSDSGASPAPSDSEAAPAPSETPHSSNPEQSDASGAAPPRLPGGWNDPTRFTTAVAPPGSGEQYPWLQAVLLALGAVLLLAIPARLLAGTISRARGGRLLWAGAMIAGRNRRREEFETAPSMRLNRWLVGGAALVAAATLVMLSGPVADRPAYLRLLVAVIIALAVVNAVGSLVPLWWSSRVLKFKASVTFLPRYLLLVAVTALGSRLLEIHPALIFGILGSVAVATDSTVVRRGQLAAVRAGSLIVLAVAGWLILGALPSADGFLSTLGAEIANSLVLAAIGSAVLVLMPIGNTSGRSILAWSPPIWAGLTVIAFTILFGVLSPVIDLWQGEGSVTLLWVATGAFAALSVGAWSWQRFVVPTLR